MALIESAIPTNLESHRMQPNDVLGLHRDLVQLQRQLVLELVPQNPSPPVPPAADPAAHAAHPAGAAAAPDDLGGHDEILGEVEVLRKEASANISIQYIIWRRKWSVPGGRGRRSL